MADVEVYGKMLSTLPDDDDHPYRSGAWRPQNDAPMFVKPVF